MDRKTIHFEIVTPERVVLQKEVLQVTVPTKEGEITVLPHHIPLISILKPGIIELKTPSGEKEIVAVSKGFIEVLRNKIVVLADTAEMAKEIDLDRAEEARKRAEDIKKDLTHKDDVSFADVLAQIEKETARAHTARRWRKLQNL
ncbi:ATP synthase F1 subunit epsilon [Candidatus Azambacteria bacterium RBG_16_47_10]|uniref:ATP synthase epsilon chain n=1 Tax=Candidatus Azambacteria bacterium RBG_16_47_10 TaxID=1797292 RepID=A0A1F5AZC3_9BACT|nr:MAG: ATP synthase F1 subunit epsilon [Candidatus Azambacteria bacterium RBG_16_47_10]